MLWVLFISNLLGSIYGFIWYGEQLSSTAWYWNFFVPDSPTSSTLFTLVLLLYIVRKSSPWLEMLSMMTNIKYGVWACSVILLFWMRGDRIDFLDLMLFTSHAAMAIEVLLYNFAYRFDWRHLWVGAVWLLVNDFLDYVFDIHPWLQDESLHQEVGLFTAVLSIATIVLVARCRPRDILRP